MTYLQDIEMTCDICGTSFICDGYQWTCDECRHPKQACVCGSDDVLLDWHIVTDPNGELIPTPCWCVECQSCERCTPYFETAKEAHTSWLNGEILTPIPGTSHFEEVW